MTSLKPFDPIINWSLLKGSHRFPGPEGGTCINEAAIVAAGFPYKAISSAHDCPPCFSRPIAAYAIGLNDRMPDDLRNELLMPFVTRLAGTKDAPEIERKRLVFIGRAVVQRLVLPMMERHGMHAEAAEIAGFCKLEGKFDRTFVRARTRAHIGKLYSLPSFAFAFADAFAFAFADADAFAVAFADAFAFAFADAVAFAFAVAVGGAGAVLAGTSAERVKAERRRVWQIGVDILDEAIRIGKQAEDVDHSLVVARMETMKREAREKASAE